MILRVRWSKLGKVRFVSHRDGARLWERALRRVDLPVAYTRGFTPRPKLSFGLALPTGAESIAEYLDVDVAGDVDLDADDGHGADALAAELTAALPVGMSVERVAERTPGSGSLQDEVTSTTWSLGGDRLTPGSIATAVERVLGSDEVLVARQRKGRRSTDDVRPMIADLRPDPSGRRLVADLVTVGRALRPAELAAVAFPDIDPLDFRVLRTHQWIDHAGERREVLSLPAGVSAPGTEPCA
jgi:radical SAM-linked protein